MGVYYWHLEVEPFIWNSIILVISISGLFCQHQERLRIGPAPEDEFYKYECIVFMYRLEIISPSIHLSRRDPCRLTVRVSAICSRYVLSHAEVSTEFTWYLGGFASWFTVYGLPVLFLALAWFVIILVTSGGPRIYGFVYLFSLFLLFLVSSIHNFFYS